MDDAQLVEFLRSIDTARTPLDAPPPERLLTLPDRLKAAEGKHGSD